MQCKNYSVHTEDYLSFRKLTNEKCTLKMDQ